MIHHLSSQLRTIPRASTLGAAALLLVAAPSAQAGVPGARSQWRRFAEVQASESAGSTTLIGKLLPGPGATRELTLRLEVSSPATCRAQVELPEGTALLQFDGGQLVQSGPALPALATWLAVGCPLFALRGQSVESAEKAVQTYASTWGVDGGASALGLLGHTPVSIAGARPRQLDRPQVWFDRASGHPVRVIARRDGKLWDVSWDDTASPATNQSAPRVSTVREGGQWALTVRLMARDIDARAVSPEVRGDVGTLVEE